MKNSRIMYFYYPNDEKLIGRLKTCLDMICRCKAAKYRFESGTIKNGYVYHPEDVIYI